MVALDTEYLSLIATLPEHLRPAAERLPQALGLERAGLLWSAYATLPPVVDLPRLVAAEAAGVDPATRAHQRGGYVGLTLDRLQDRQNVAAVEDAVVQALTGAWIDALDEVVGRPGVAALQVEAAMVDLRRAFLAEDRCWSARSLEAADYVGIVRDKTRWFGLAARALVGRERPEAVADFDQMFESLMLSLQTYDDALDACEDREARGASVADLLGCDDRALYLAAAGCARRAAAIAGGRGWRELRDWLLARADAMAAAAGPDLDFGLSAFGAVRIAAAFG